MRKLEKISTANLDELIAISRETFADTFGKDNTPEDLKKYLDESYSVEKMTRELKTDNSNFWFLKDDGKIVGYLKLNVGDAQSEVDYPNAMEVERIYIKPGNKRRGYGSDLMNFSVAQAEDAGINEIWLGVWEHNEPAKAFYAKMGFKEIGDHVFQLGTESQRDLIMMKSLA